MRIFKSLLSLLTLCILVAAAPNNDWKDVEAALGRAGTVQPDGAYKVSFPRGDLSVTADGVAIKPALALGSWAAFNASGAHAMAMGDLVLLESEVNPVITELQKGGVEASAIHNHLIGGGFGRRLEPDMVVKAIRVAKHVDGPVKFVWTREEDIRHDLYRPVYYDRLTATLKDGKIDGWLDRVTGPSIVARWLPPAFTANHNIDFDEVDSAVDVPYAIPNLRVEQVRWEALNVPTGFWRGVGPNNNVFAIESFIDELARHAGKDPVEFRRAHLTKTPRLLAALDVAAEKSGWGSPLPPRHGRGVSVQVSFASFIATVASVEVDEGGNVKLHRLTTAVENCL